MTFAGASAAVPFVVAVAAASAAAGSAAMARAAVTCAAAALCLVVACELTAFLAPTGVSQRQAASTAARTGVSSIETPAATSSSGGSATWGAAAAALTIGAHLGLAMIRNRGATTRHAETATKKKETDEIKYIESAADARLFQEVYHEYTAEYLKGPMYWHEDKLQGWLPDNPGTPMYKNGKMTSNHVMPVQNFSSDELTYFSFLFFAIGLYGHLQWNIYDPQWLRAQMGENFNVTYIVESFFLTLSFPLHIAAYIQKQNGK
jgi:hypothetical protein